MISLKIDGRSVEVEDGATVLDACKKLDIEVPTLCYLDDCSRFASCMVCVVKDSESGRMLPSCSAPAQDGMQIEASSEDVRQLRRDALDLLLSEHVGDCDAPCERVCPAHIRIPRMIRQIASEAFGAAAVTARANDSDADDPCADCARPCEKACRRRQHDDAVAIAMLVKHALGQEPDATIEPGQPYQKQFNTTIGRLQEGEMAEFLKEADPGPRVEDPVKEAARCLHCDCRKADDCSLRDYAGAYGANPRRYKPDSRHPVIRNMQHADVVYEPGKCIRCGLCVRITSRDKETLGLTFIGRGFDVRVAVPFSEPLSEALKSTAAKCIDACPTGALAHRDDR